MELERDVSDPDVQKLAYQHLLKCYICMHMFARNTAITYSYSTDTESEAKEIPLFVHAEGLISFFSLL